MSRCTARTLDLKKVQSRAKPSRQPHTLSDQIGAAPANFAIAATTERRRHRQTPFSGIRYVYLNTFEITSKDIYLLTLFVLDRSLDSK